MRSLFPHVRFIELMPVGDASFSDKHYLPNRMVLDSVPELQPVTGDLEGLPALYYKKPGFGGKVGLISAVSHKFCQNCNRLRLTADGKLRVCLHRNETINLRDPFRRGEDIRTIITRAILYKPIGHNLENGIHLEENMMQVGG